MTCDPRPVPTRRVRFRDPRGDRCPRLPLILAGLVASVALASCGAAIDTSQPRLDTSHWTPTAPVSSGVPVPLSAYGLTHGPAEFRLPGGLPVVQKVDQSNVVTLLFTADRGPAVNAWLVANLPAMGWTVRASSTDSVVFDGPGWSGAFTSSNGVAGFTLRRTSA